jgi:hypothetical protein
MKDCGEEVSDTVYPEQLRLMLRMEYKHLTDEQFRSAFELALNGEKDGVVLPSYIVTTPLGLIRSTFGRKSFSCRANEFIYEWWLTVTVVFLTGFYLTAKATAYSRKRSLTKRLLAAIEQNTHTTDGRIQGMSVLDLRDSGMPLYGVDDKSARKILSALMKSHQDIQGSPDVQRAGEFIYYSGQRARADLAAQAKGSTKSGESSPRRKLSSQ